MENRHSRCNLPPTKNVAAARCVGEHRKRRAARLRSSETSYRSGRGSRTCLRFRFSRETRPVILVRAPVNMIDAPEANPRDRQRRSAHMPMSPSPTPLSRRQSARSCVSARGLPRGILSASRRCAPVRKPKPAPARVAESWPILPRQQALHGGHGYLTILHKHIGYSAAVEINVLLFKNFTSGFQRVAFSFI